MLEEEGRLECRRKKDDQNVEKKKDGQNVGRSIPY